MWRQRLLGCQRHPEHGAREARQGGLVDQSEPRDGLRRRLFVSADGEGGRNPGSEGLRQRRPECTEIEAKVLQRRAGRGDSGRADAGASGGRSRSAACERRDYGVPAAVPRTTAIHLRDAEVREAVPRQSHLERRAIHIHQGRSERITRGLRNEGRRPSRRQLSNPRRHIRRAEGPRAGVPRTREGTVRLSARALTMSDVVASSDVAPVTDRRPVPRGVLPRGMQTWLMVAIAMGMLAVILLTGRAEPPARTTAVPTSAPSQPNTDRVRDYQDRLRIMESRAAQEARGAGLAQPQPPTMPRDAPPPVRSEDPLVSERKRRNYESLFASNVVLSRRPENQRPDAGQARTTTAAPARGLADPAAPSIDEIPDAPLRGSMRGTGAPVANTAGSATTALAATRSPQERAGSQRPGHTAPIDDGGPLH